MSADLDSSYNSWSPFSGGSSLFLEETVLTYSSLVVTCAAYLIYVFFGAYLMQPEVESISIAVYLFFPFPFTTVPLTD